MANLPASGYLSNAARTEAEMQTAFESLRDVVAELGSTAPTTRTIASGNLPVPNASLVLVRSEGYSTGADDVLNTITTTGIDQGRIVILRNSNTASTEAASSEKITISHGTGANAIELTDGASFILCADRLIALVYNGTRWLELWRSYGRKNAQDATAERAYLGLGTAAVEAIATAVGAGTSGKLLKVGAATSLAENAILALDANGNIKAGSADGGNAQTLDSLNSTDFVRSTSTTNQGMAANLTLTTSGGTRVNVKSTGSAQTLGYGIYDNTLPRAHFLYTQSDGNAFLATQDILGAWTPSIRLNPSNDRLEFSTGGLTSWQSLRPGSGNGLDADTVDGVEYATILNSIQKSNATWYLPSDDVATSVGGSETELVRYALGSNFSYFSSASCEVTVRAVLTGPNAATVQPAEIYFYLDTGISGGGATTTGAFHITPSTADHHSSGSGAGFGWTILEKTFNMRTMPANLNSLVIAARNGSFTNSHQLRAVMPVSSLTYQTKTSFTIRKLEDLT